MLFCLYYNIKLWCILLLLVLRYADGVLPGQGSPDHSEEATNVVVSSLSQSLTNTTSTIVKK